MPNGPTAERKSEAMLTTLPSRTLRVKSLVNLTCLAVVRWGYAFFIAFRCLAALAADTNEMSVVGVKEDPAYEAILGDAWTLYLDDEIDAYAAKRLEGFIISNRVPRRSWVILNSPGGSLFGGIELGKIIRKYDLRTDVGKQKTAQPRPLEYNIGGCYSACTLAYVGGTFRYLKSGSHFGIHRFAFAVPEKRETDLAQMASASIVAYLRSMDIDSELFTLSTEAGPSEIYEPSIDILEKLNVVNSGVTKPKWTMESKGGVIYLKGERYTVYGINKYILMCNTSKMILHVIFDPQRRNSWVLSAQAHSLVIDDHETPISPVMKFITNGWFNAEYVLSPEQVISIRRAKTLGLIVQAAYGAPVFLGFNRLPFGDGAVKLDGLMNSCGIGQSRGRSNQPAQK